MSVKGDEVGNRYEDLSPEELQSRFDKEVFFAGYRGSPRLNSKFLGRKVVFSKKAAQHVKDKLKKMTDKGEKKDSFGGLPVTGEQMEIEKVTDEGYRKRFEKLSKLARKAKDYRGIHEIELLVNLIGALELGSDDAAKLAKVKLLVDGQIKSLYVGLKFGWSALKDDSSDSLFGINKEDAEKFESLAAKGKEEYLARVAKYRRPVGTSTGVSVPQPTSNYGVGSGRKNRGNSPCFLCNQLGHWASECPTKKR